MENNFITAIIKLKIANEKGKEFLKYSFIRNRKSSIDKFISFAKKKHDAEYINFYASDRKFLYRFTIDALPAKLS